LKVKWELIIADVLWAVNAAFIAGQESSYDFKNQEVERIYDILIQRMSLHQESVKKKPVIVEKKDGDKFFANPQFDDTCPRCKSLDALIEHKYNVQTIDGGVISTLTCVHCRWQGTFKDMLQYMKSKR
jgi:hypothetical protein